MSPESNIHLAFDTGGTFTDVVAADGHDRFVFEKVLSTPENPSIAIIEGLTRAVSRLARPASDIQVLRGATTLVTNALIERKGAVTALVTTKGFTDVLEMRRELRYDIYDLGMELPEPYVPRNRRFGLDERVDKDGTILLELTETAGQSVIDQIRASGATALAVCFLHSYRNGHNENRFLQAVSERAPDIAITLSSDLVPEIREYERMSTTVINAYTQPIMRNHVRELHSVLEKKGFAGTFDFMLSSGKLRPSSFAADAPAQLVESGPAAGAIVASYAGKRAGFSDIISFDMGGTTAKICVMPEGEPRIAPALEVARTERFRKGSGHPLQMPATELIEIGAGGGSIANVDRLGLLKVGPQSAGASPGPACYGLGGTKPTVTDANLLLGYLDPGYFLGGEMRLDEEAAKEAVGILAGSISMDPVSAAWGIHDVANQNMARAARVHIAELGIDPHSYVLVAFGGAGPSHACRVAKQVGIGKVLCPPGSGVASALGLTVAPPGVDLVRSRPEPIHPEDITRVEAVINEMLQQALSACHSMQVPDRDIRFRLSVDARYVGQGHEINVPLDDFLDVKDQSQRAEYVRRQFDKAYAELHTRSFPELPVEAVNWRVAAVGRGREDLWWFPLDDDAQQPPARERTSSAYFVEGHGWMDTLVVHRQSLSAGWSREGPLIIQEHESTTVVPPDAKAQMDDLGNIVIEL